ncbi:MAG: serine/threonine protein kinase [Verrucomicrobia bacterium]|nr:serine/threonine protein kinase [Verrucomicrobiota bacterium]
MCTLAGALIPPDEPGLATERLRRVGDYELLEEVARGGIGVVFRARQSSLDRTVAVKLLLAGLFADPKARQRFRTEAEAAARIHHPNVVSVLEVGEHEGQPFLAMEFVEGGTLAQQVANGPLPVARAARYLAKTARAVAYAHALGVLHRDLKPSNILLDAFDEPRVTDFGLAKVLGTDWDLTLSGEILGSPAFMAPEQAAGRTAEVSPATDVYALGALLYHLTTGRPPFASGTPAAVLRLVEHEEPIAPRRLNPSVPRDLETIILKCLEKRPTRRYATAATLADDLDRFLEGRTVTARPLGPPRADLAVEPATQRVGRFDGPVGRAGRGLDPGRPAHQSGRTGGARELAPGRRTPRERPRQCLCRRSRPRRPGHRGWRPGPDPGTA